MGKEGYIFFDAFVDGAVTLASLNLINKGHYEAVLGLAICGAKIIYDFEMLRIDEPTTCSGLIYYGTKCLVKGIKNIKNKVKSLK